MTALGLSGASQVSAGDYNTCALIRKDGTLRCWGDNFYGQLGDQAPGDLKNLRHSRPVRVVGLKNVTSVSSAWNTTCARLANSTAKCWGSGYFGQLGTGKYQDSWSPIPVATSGRVSQISEGTGFGCLLIKGGPVKCWGYNADGELGDNTVTLRLAPVRVIGIG